MKSIYHTFVINSSTFTDSFINFYQYVSFQRRFYSRYKLYSPAISAVIQQFYTNIFLSGRPVLTVFPDF